MSLKTRYIALDTETTGLKVEEGDRIISVGAVELINWREGDYFDENVNPRRSIGEGAQRIHGITDNDLKDSPYFEDIAENLLQFIEGAELVIHNAQFDVGFLNNELKLMGMDLRIDEACPIIHDSRLIAQRRYPGASTSLDAMCRRFKIDLSGREKHGALIDARLLAQVWIHLNSEQKNLSFDTALNYSTVAGVSKKDTVIRPNKLRILAANALELERHQNYIKNIGSDSVWVEMDNTTHYSKK